MSYSYSPIVNQPLQSPANVIRGIFRLIHSSDPSLSRLEELWRFSPEGVSLFDKFNRRPVLFGIPATDGSDPMSFCLDGDFYIPDPGVTVGRLNDLVEIINENYFDKYLFKRSDIGYTYYRAHER